MPFYMTGRVPASRACNYLQNVVATTYKKFLQFYAKRSCKKQSGWTLTTGMNDLFPVFCTDFMCALIHNF